MENEKKLDEGSGGVSFHGEPCPDCGQANTARYEKSHSRFGADYFYFCRDCGCRWH